VRRILSLTLFALGALTMSADAQKDPFDTTITFKRWLPHLKQFANAEVKNVKAKKIEAKGVIIWELSGALVGGPATVGSEITDKEGKVYVVEKLDGGGVGGSTCHVKPKP